MFRTQLYLPSDLYKTLQLLAKRENIPVAQTIREVLVLGIKIKQKNENPGKALLQFAKLGVKGLDKNLSLAIDQELYS